MKKVLIAAVLGLGTALFTGCGKDTGTNASGTHDTLTIYYGDTTGGMVWNVMQGIPMTSSYPHIHSLIWGGNLFVAVGDTLYSGAVFTSPDGIMWTRQTVARTPTTLNKVIWAKNTYVAVGNAGTISTSSDGINWSGQTSGLGIDLYCAVYGADKFLAYGGYDTVLTSADGLSWTKSATNLGLGGYLDDIAWGNNRFIAAMADSIYTSTDGLTWTNIGLSGAYEAKVIWADSEFVAASYYNILTSPDGITWTNRGRTSSDRVGGIAWGNGKFVVAKGDCNLTSLDGIIWNLENGLPQAEDSPWSLAYGAGKFVAVNTMGVVLTSPW
jgi:hypothetical protein